MRILLAMVAFVLAAPFIGYGVWLSYVLIQMGYFSQPIQLNSGKLVYIAAVGVTLLIGFAFMAAGIAMLVTKPRRE